MALIQHVYHDAAMSTQFDDSTDTLGAMAVNGTSGKGVFYVGTPESGNKLQDATNPGVDPIELSIVDASAGSGVEASHIKLALSEAGLSSATGGAALSLGTSIAGGTGLAVHYQWDNSVGDSTYTEISLLLSSRIEVAQ